MVLVKMNWTKRPSLSTVWFRNVAEGNEEGAVSSEREKRTNGQVSVIRDDELDVYGQWCGWSMTHDGSNAETDMTDNTHEREFTTPSSFVCERFSRFWHQKMEKTSCEIR